MKKRIFLMMSMLIGSMIAHNSYGMEPEQVSIKPVMPQQQLLAKKDIIEGKVKYMWEECLKVLVAIFPGLIDKSEKNLSIKYDFEKLPKTDENILLIKAIVQEVFDKIPKSFMRFDKQTKTIQEQALTRMLKRMITTALIETLLKEESGSLEWCTCTAEYKRITLALLVVNEAREKYPNKNQRIVYTSLASGSLLQDYVILSELLQTHTNILVNIIDLEYPDIPALAKKDLDPEDPRDLHMLEMKNKQEHAATIDSFKIKMAQIISTRPVKVDYNFDVTIYQNAYDYITHAKQNPNDKSNILIMTDPAIGSYGMEDFPSLANVINIWVDEEKAPVFTLYLPRHHGVQLYELIGFKFEDKPIAVTPKTMQHLRNVLFSLLVQTGASKNYTPRLVQSFLSRTILNEQVTDEAMARIGFSQLMEMRSKLKEQALKDDYLPDFGQPLTPIKLGNVPVLLSWGADAHISFQDLVWDALVPNAIVYQLYATDHVNTKKDNDKIVKVNPEIYKKSDVITPNSGRYSSVKREIEEVLVVEELPEEEIIYEPEDGVGDIVEPEEEYYSVSEGLYKRIL